MLEKKSNLVNCEIPEDYIIQVNFKWIKSFDEFKEKYKRKNWNFDQRYKSVEEFLDEISNLKDMDPIVYLHYITYSIDNWLSAENLLNELQKIWLKNYNNIKSIYALFRNTFKWDWFDKNNNTRSSTIKQQLDNPNHINKQRQKLEEKEIENLYEKIILSVDKILFKDLNNKKTLNEKIIYILYNLNFIIKGNDLELANFIKKYKDKWIWFLKTAKIIKWLIIKVKPEIWNEINVENLKKRLNEGYNKYYKTNSEN